jgi:hypothetical protein
MKAFAKNILEKNEGFSNQSHPRNSRSIKLHDDRMKGAGKRRILFE